MAVFWCKWCKIELSGNGNEMASMHVSDSEAWLHKKAIDNSSMFLIFMTMQVSRHGLWENGNAIKRNNRIL